MRGMRWTTIALVFGLVAFWCASGRLTSQTDTAWGWTNKEFGPVLDALMPLQRESGPYVTYRANRDLYTSTPEYWFMVGLEPDPDGRLRRYLSAHVRVAQPTSIYDQLMAIHRDEPGTQEATSALQKRIKLQAADFDEMNCPAVKRQVEKLKELRVTLPDVTSGTIVLHPMIHAFHISGSVGGATMFLTDDDNPLVKWAEETRRNFDLCSKPR
jgi:hypothetical protein